MKLTSTQICAKRMVSMELGITREEAEFFLDIIRFYWKSLELTAKDYSLCASLIMANSLLKNGYLPSFEFNLIAELRKKANKMIKPIN